MLSDEIKRVAGLPICSSEVATRYVARAGEGNLTRDEDPATHFCVYFLPYNPATKQIFMVHHKKAGIWLAPGGHIDRGESLHGTLEREMREELGVSTDGSDFNVDPREFITARWMAIPEARGMVIDPANIEMLDKMEARF